MSSRPSRPGMTPMRGGYLVRNPLLYAWLRAVDGLHGRRASSARPVSPIKRVLVCVGGHRGDAVIATSMLAALQRALPDVRIGILTGSWNAEVFDSHPRVERVHAIDLWQWNRTGGWLARWRLSRATEARTRADVARAGYDAALDLSPYYPNFATTLRDMAIPIRAGFTSGGYGALYTHPVTWRPGRHVTEDHLALLSVVVANVGDIAPPYELGPHSAQAVQRVDELLASRGVDPERYVVLHAGAGVSRKEWPVAKWAEVARQLSGAGVQVVLTGVGARERAITSAIKSAAPASLDLCDQLTWNEFRRIIARSRAVVAVDTVAVHIAAAEGTPCVTIMTAMDNIQRWRPRSTRTLVVTRDVPCAPCYRSRGCADMSCIRDVEPAEVLAAAHNSLQTTAIS